MVSPLKESNSTSKVTSSATSSATSTLYQPLKQFLPISLEQQLKTVCLQGLPSHLSIESIDAFIKSIFSYISLNLQVESWTAMNLTGLDRQDIFIRVRSEDGESEEMLLADSLLRLRSLLGTLENEDGMVTNLTLHWDSNTNDFINDHKSPSSTIDVNENDVKFKSFLKELEDKNKNADKNATSNELAALNDEQYHIDLNTLSDLPRDSLDQLCKDIIEFRTKVVSIEREKRLKEDIEENKRRKQQMMKTFEQIRKTKNAFDQSIVEDEQEDEMDDEDDGEDDLIIENRRLERIEQESNERYQGLLKDLLNNIEPGINKLKQSIQQAENYESILLENKALYLKELLYSANDAYYDHHRSFKEQEIEMDRKDREKHGDLDVKTLENQGQQSIAISGTANHGEMEHVDKKAIVNKSAPSGVEQQQLKIKFAFKKAIDKSVDTSPSNEEEEEQTEVLKEQSTSISKEDNLPFSDEELEQRLLGLRKSRIIDELVKEYLGVYDDDLVEYIIVNIKENKSKKYLLNELRETFDEDSVSIVDNIWNSKEFN